jgi:hypothetical protein
MLGFRYIDGFHWHFYVVAFDERYCIIEGRKRNKGILCFNVSGTISL